MFKKLLKFIYNDFKTDIQFIINEFKRIKNNESFISQSKLDSLKAEYLAFGGFGNYIIAILKDHWLTFIMMALFFVAGMWYAQQDCQDKCNTFINDNYLSKLGNELIYQDMRTRAEGFNFSKTIIDIEST